MFKKLKNEVNAIKWPNKKTILEDMKVVSICSVILMVIMTGIELGMKYLLTLI